MKTPIETITDAETGAELRVATRADNFDILGHIEACLELPPRPETDFTAHADHQNYLRGRGASAV